MYKSNLLVILMLSNVFFVNDNMKLFGFLFLLQKYQKWRNFDFQQYFNHPIIFKSVLFKFLNQNIYTNLVNIQFISIMQRKYNRFNIIVITMIECLTLCSFLNILLQTLLIYFIFHILLQFKINCLYLIRIKLIINNLKFIILLINFL